MKKRKQNPISRILSVVDCAVCGYAFQVTFEMKGQEPQKDAATDRHFIEALCPSCGHCTRILISDDDSVKEKD